MKNAPKILAFHLPQFHSFPENDRWWGYGFTEWVNVKKTKPLFEGHKQPRIPLEGYYNLLDYDTRKRQAELAKKYGVYGFCYYHYWFNGKLFMEKPLEYLLNEKEIDLPFCFCWANEAWTRAWDGQTAEVLMPQNYGTEKEWLKHFEYLKKFFLDDRYIKVNNCPMIVLYRTCDIPSLNDMVMTWDSECKKIGFDGIHVVEELNGGQKNSYSQYSKGLVDFEPGFTQRFGKNKVMRGIEKIKNGLRYKLFHRGHVTFNYDTVWKKILNRNYSAYKKPVYLGGFVDWDNSPRRKKGAKIFLGATPQKFKKYFLKLYKMAIENESEFVFINAWNEWAEGAYLEPDQINGYAYLEAIEYTVNVEKK